LSIPYGNVVFNPLNFLVDLIINLISKIYHECEKTKPHIIVLQKHLIITY